MSKISSLKWMNIIFIYRALWVRNSEVGNGGSSCSCLPRKCSKDIGQQSSPEGLVETGYLLWPRFWVSIWWPLSYPVRQWWVFIELRFLAHDHITRLSAWPHHLVSGLPQKIKLTLVMRCTENLLNFNSHACLGVCTHCRHKMGEFQSTRYYCVLPQMMQRNFILSKGTWDPTVRGHCPESRAVEQRKSRSAL